MADIRLLVMRLHVVGQIGAQIMRRFGLAPAGDVVFLTFHGQQGRPGDLAAIDQPAIVHHGAVGQGMIDEDTVSTVCR